MDKEPEFGKPLKSSKAFDTPPYYAVQIFPLARKNFGGVKTDLQCRVLDKHFEPIPGLYAAGELCGMAGGHINGRAGLEGTMLGPSVFSGRVAGGWAAHEAGPWYAASWASPTAIERGVQSQSSLMPELTVITSALRALAMSALSRLSSSSGEEPRAT